MKLFYTLMLMALITFCYSPVSAIYLSIYGPSELCPGEEATFSATTWMSVGVAAGGCQLTWQVREGGVLKAGGNGSSFTYTFSDDFQGNAEITFNSGFCNLPANPLATTTKTKNVNIRLVPLNPVIGPSSICSNTTWTRYTVLQQSSLASNCYFHHDSEWDVPSGWQAVQGISGSFNYVDVKPTSSSAGNYTIRHRGINHNAGSTPWRSITVLVNKPSTVEIAGSSHQACENDYDGFSASGAVGATSFQWTLPSGWGFSGSSTTRTITASTNASGGNISVRASNVCGNSNTDTESVSVIDCGGGHLLIMYPNPAEDDLNIEMVKSDVEIGPKVVEKFDLVIKIFDGGQHNYLDRSLSITNRSSLDISSLPPGTYFVHIIYNGKTEIRQLVKK